jgi:hypothetical protein
MRILHLDEIEPARRGRHQRRSAVALEPEQVRRWAADDSDLDSLRDDPAFPT